MSEEKWAIITGADGGMGTEITRAVAAAGYHVIMACYRQPLWPIRFWNVISPFLC